MKRLDVPFDPQRPPTHFQLFPSDIDASIVNLTPSAAGQSEAWTVRCDIKKTKHELHKIVLSNIAYVLKRFKFDDVRLSSKRVVNN